MNGMQYLQPKFSAPAGPANVSQEEWDRIFKSEEKRDTTNVKRGAKSDRKDAE
jgi:hypothetical protein